MIFKAKRFPLRFVSDEGFWFKPVNRFEYNYVDEEGVAKIYTERLGNGRVVVYLSNLQDEDENPLPPERDALVAEGFKLYLKFYDFKKLEFA